MIDLREGYRGVMDPTKATHSTTGPAPMNSVPDGPRSKAESGEHGIPVDADPEELDDTDGTGPEG